MLWPNVIIAIGQEAPDNGQGMTSLSDNLTAKDNKPHDIPFTYDNNGSFVITDVSLKQDTSGVTSIIGLIQNKDPINPIDGVSLAIQMYDKTNHLIGVETGTAQTSIFFPDDKTAFEIRDYEVDSIPDHIHIQIFASNCGNNNNTDNK
jgi:hypothetical protein